MDNKKQKKDISNLEFDNLNSPNDYEALVHKLKSIKETINLLEKHSLEKEI